MFLKKHFRNDQRKPRTVCYEIRIIKRFKKMTESCVSSNEYPSVFPSLHSKSSENGCRYVSSPSSRGTTSSAFSFLNSQRVNKFDYAKAKALLQQPSYRTGDNLFSHLVELINRIIDERPKNVIDFFENFSRELRSKTQASHRSVIEEPQFLALAKAFMEFLKPPDEPIDVEDIEELESYQESEMTTFESFDSLGTKVERPLSEKENTIQILHIWSFCGIGFNIDEAFQLSMAVQKVQKQSCIRNAHFWGRIFALKGSYYVVEAILTSSEAEDRLDEMKNILFNEMSSFLTEKDNVRSGDAANLDLIPGAAQTNLSEKMINMRTKAPPVPQLVTEKKFRCPPEPVGFGLNRRTYFVTTSLSEDWQELPMVTPEQIKASRKIRKLFTGDLESSLDTYPLFPGTEKHFLRAVISRITSGTNIAPLGFYRKMTKHESQQIEKYEDEDEEDLESEDGNSLNNDPLVTQNENYKPLSLEKLVLSSNWVHVRPNILNQGRVVHVDEELAIKDLQEKVVLSLNGTSFDENEDLQEENFADDEEETIMTPAETGPQLFSSCNEDSNTEGVPPWTARYSSLFNKTNQMILMRSNLWPGAYSVAFDNFCDSIYFGWGLKYVSRCMSLQNAPIIQEVNGMDSDCEAIDPTVKMEEKWRQYYEKKIITDVNEEMSDISVEVDFDDEED